jgi:hypothetical protein
MQIPVTGARCTIVWAIHDGNAPYWHTIKNVGSAKIQRVQQKIPGCWTYVQQNENKFQKVCVCVRVQCIGKSIHVSDR